METLRLPSQSMSRACWNCDVRCRTKQGQRDRVCLRSAYSPVQTSLTSICKVVYHKQLRAGHRGGMGSVEAKMSTEEEVDDVPPIESESEDKVSPVDDIPPIESEREDKVFPVDDVPPIESEREDEVSPVKSERDDGVAESVALLKAAAKTKKVTAAEVCAAMRTIEKAKLDPSNFLTTIGGTKSPGRTWMLVFASKLGKEKNIEGSGQYFPVTAVQKFDVEASTIENGVFLGSIGTCIFSGQFSWEKRKLNFFL